MAPSRSPVRALAAHHGRRRGAALGTPAVARIVRRDGSRAIVLEAERREVVVGGRREEIERVDAARLRVGDRCARRARVRALRAPSSAHGDRAEQRVVAADLEAGDTHDVGARLGDDERRKRLAHAVERKSARREQALDGGKVGGRRCATWRSVGVALDGVDHRDQTCRTLPVSNRRRNRSRESR